VSPFDWSKRSGSAESTLKTVGVWSMFQHASGHPEAAACVPYHPKTDY
jgi:hypothetical protein